MFQLCRENFYLFRRKAEKTIKSNAKITDDNNTYVLLINSKLFRYLKK